MKLSNEQAKEILREYEIELDAYKKAHKEHRKFLNSLPYMLSTAQKMERAYRREEFSEICKVFYKRKEYFKRRLREIGIDTTLNENDLSIARMNEYKYNSGQRDNAMIRATIPLLREKGMSDEEMAQRLHMNMEEFKILEAKSPEDIKEAEVQAIESEEEDIKRRAEALKQRFPDIFKIDEDMEPPFEN